MSPKADATKWRLARRAAAALTDTFLSSGVDDVIAEGDFFSAAERGEYITHVTTKKPSER